jgi:type VI secretion system protein ImpF
MPGATFRSKSAGSSLLNRLCSRGPANAPLFPGSRGASSLRTELARSLEDLLNTRRGELLVPPEFREVSFSVLNFGLPDFTLYNLRHPSDQLRLRTEIEQAVQTFEPRLRNVLVTLDEWDEVRPVLRFILTATVVGKDAEREPLLLETELHLESGDFKVAGGAR